MLALTSLGVACSPPAPPAAPPEAAPKPDLAAEERGIRETDARWLKAAQEEDAAGEAANMAPRRWCLSQSASSPWWGQPPIRRSSRNSERQTLKLKPSWSTDKIQVGEAGDVAIQLGQHHATGLGSNGSGEDRGRFLTVWKKVNGEWKVAHDMSSTTMPEPSSQKKP